VKLQGRDAAAFCARPDPDCLGVLLHGPDAGQILEQRRRLIAAAMGGETDPMRLTELDAGEARRDASAIDAALRARGFFPGRRVVLIAGGTDGLAKPLGAVVGDLTAEDALLVVTADVLPTRSGLRKLFEGTRGLIALQFFADAMDGPAIDAALAEAGLTAGLTDEARAALADLAREMDHGGFAQFLRLVALYGLDCTRPLDGPDIEALAPRGLEAEIDDFVAAVADGRPKALGGLLRRLKASGAAPVSVLLALQRHFRVLLRAASLPGGGEAALNAMRPPLWGPRRRAVAAQLRSWTLPRLEQAARLIFEADGRLRSAARPPEWAVVERCALRLAIMGAR